MAETIISTANRVKQWESKFFTEYVRTSRFKRYMGQSENSIIQVTRNLQKKKGDAITVPLLGALDASSGYNDGSTQLVGAEKALPNEGHRIEIGVVRDATIVNLEEEQASPVAIREAGRTALMTLAKRYLKDDIVTALGSVHGTPYATAAAALRDEWNVANSDRILYGDDIANFDPVHATALANIPAAQTLTKEVVSKLKRIAQEAVVANGEGIRPFTYGEDEETYVLFAGTRAYRDLKLDMASVHENARERARSNPLFTGTTSLYWDGVVVREIPELPNLGAVGTAGALVSPVYLCGSQALAVAWAQTTKTTVRKEDDYGFRHGVGFFEMRGIEKLEWMQGDPAAKDWGMVTGFVAAAADA